MIIVGAGLAGLLAANMLSHRKPTVVEAQPELPNNHSAVLRFRTSQIGDITNIPFRQVTMIKCTKQWRNPVADALAYSDKNTGKYRSDRSINTGTISEHRYIAPADLISRLAKNVNIQFSTRHNFNLTAGVVISTIPMPDLMAALEYPGNRPAFKYTSGTNITARIRDCDAYASVLVPDPSLPFSRISLTGDEVIAECYRTVNDIKGTMMDVAAVLGIPEHRISAIQRHDQRYAKIDPVDDMARRDFMFWATVNHNVYSLGRFATWRPGLLLDDLVKDIRLINGWIERSDTYSVARHR